MFFRKHVISLALLAFFLFLAVGSTEEDGQTPSSAPESTLENKLAVIHRGGYVANDDPLVMRFARVLDRLEAKCPESRQRLADMGVKGRQLLLERNIDEPLLAVFENWRGSIPDEVEKGDVGECSQILSAYIALRAGG